TNASWSIRFSSRSSRVFPATNDAACSHASTMWAMRSSSRGDVIHRLGVSDDFLAEPRTEITGGAQIDPMADDDLLELQLHTRHVEKADAATGFEFDQEVDVAVGREIVAQRAAEHREVTNAI